MDRNKPSDETAFNVLPIELNKEIAHYLHDHQDIANFRAVCRATWQAVDGDNLSFWRAKFREDFAMPPNRDNLELCRQYQERWRLLRRFVTMKTSLRYQFVRGYTAREQAIVSILRDLINESFTGSAQLSNGSRPHCLNMDRLQEFVFEARFLIGGRRPPAPQANQPAAINVTFAAVRLMATHFLFDQAIPQGGWFAIDEAQKAVYAATNAAPLFIGPKRNLVNMDWFLHCMNFFRYYMTTPEVADLYREMQELDENERPSAWKEALKSGSYPLGSYWKGTYAFLDHRDLQGFRELTRLGMETSQIFTDLNIDEGRIQSLYLDFLPEDNSLTWPTIFEQGVHSLRDFEASASFAQAQQSNVPEATPSIRFDGWGADVDDHFFATGWLNALPAQCGIPGWQRISFMKHFAANLNAIDRDNLWAYEGVVLPGGRIILGRWWFASDNNTSFDSEFGGPFIFWAVDPELEDDGAESEEREVATPDRDGAGMDEDQVSVPSEEPAGTE